jgi:hypothetical protein
MAKTRLTLNERWLLWAARACIGLVLVSNMQAAVAFWLWPERFAGGYELSGEVGAVVVRAVGLLFLMWNVPYAVALTHPLRQAVSLAEAVAMQAIGLAGETLLRQTVSANHPVLEGSITRFILFDAAGLFLLLAAGGLVLRLRKGRLEGKDFVQEG